MIARILLNQRLGVSVVGLLSVLFLVQLVSGRCLGMEPVGVIKLSDTLNSNVFFPDEEVRMRVVIVFKGDPGINLISPVVHYRITDYWDRVVSSGMEELHQPTKLGGWVEITPPLPSGQGIGWFKVNLELRDGDRVVPLENPALATGEPAFTFAVVSKPESGPKPDSFFGVCEHGLDDNNAEVMHRAGIRWVRTDVRWQNIQSSRGSAFNWSELDRVMETAEKFGIEVLPIIGYTSPFAANSWEGARKGDPRFYPPRAEDWKAFVKALVERYRDRVSCWEVWNEANNPNFWLGTPADYSSLLREAYKEIKSADPAALVSVAGTGGVDLGWIRKVVNAGGGAYMDVVSVHPYRQPSSPEAGLIVDLVRTWGLVRNELPPRADGKVERQVWITEMGYHTLGDSTAVSEKDQARFLVRAIVQAMAVGVKRFFWYEFADGAIDAHDKEANFGIVHSDLSPKPAYVAYATAERMLGEARYCKTLAFNQRSLRAYTFETPTGNTLVAWTASGSERVKWPAAGPVTLIDIMGRKQTLLPHEGTVELSITESPVYLEGIDLSEMKNRNIAVFSDDPLAGELSTTGSITINLVQNSGFEEAAPNSDGPEGWKLAINRDSRFSWTYVRHAADSPEGEAYMRLKNEFERAPHVYGRMYCFVPVEPYTTYRMSIKVRTKSAKRAFLGGGPGWRVSIQLPEDTQGEWMTVEGIFTTGSETSWYLHILLDDVNEQVDVDDVRVYKISNASSLLSSSGVP
ncbi:MAG: beta-galactosidase [Limnochordales bacterium]|nr:beta-galactosidase [Limnochordales bacterium]